MSDASEPGAIETVAVIGAGTMGRGIAQVSAQAGCNAILFDASLEQAAAARDAIEATLDTGVDRGKVTGEDRTATLDRLSTVYDLATAVSDADLVVEAIPEKLDLKRSLFADLDHHCRPSTILASNTSSLSIAALADATDRPDRVIGLHFFNPVHIMQLVEIVVGEATAEVTRDAMVGLVRSMGKVPIVVRDTPGFATSRLGIALGLEAMRMVEEGVASAADIDTAMELGYRHPMGPLKLTDLVGLDVRLSIAEHLASTLDGARFAPPAILRRLVDDGRLGRKSGVGFYDWSSEEPEPAPLPDPGDESEEA